MVRDMGEATMVEHVMGHLWGHMIDHGERERGWEIKKEQERERKMRRGSLECSGSGH